MLGVSKPAAKQARRSAPTATYPAEVQAPHAQNARTITRLVVTANELRADSGAFDASRQIDG
jgi:hypothetical protein